MFIKSIPALLALASFIPAHAAGATNAILEKHEAFKASKARLESEINGFLVAVNSCEPPLGKAQIIDGFAGPENKDNALALLNIREIMIAAYVADAEIKLNAIASEKNCKEGREAILKDVKIKLQAQFDLYLEGNAVAAKNEDMVRMILRARETRVGKLASTQEQLDGCKKALTFLGEEGKNNGLLRSSDKIFQDSLSELIKAYPERLASNGCGLVNAGSANAFPSNGSALEASESDDFTDDSFVRAAQ